MVLLQCFSLDCLQAGSNVQIPHWSLWTPSAQQCLQKIYTRLREEKIFTDMLKAEKCSKATAGPAAQRCVNVSAWTLHLHQECAATVQLLSWRDLERLCAITLKTSRILVRLDYVISLYRGLEFTWENIILIHLQLWEKITEECWPKFKVLAIISSIFPWTGSGWGGVNSVLASLVVLHCALVARKVLTAAQCFGCCCWAVLSQHQGCLLTCQLGLGWRGQTARTADSRDIPHHRTSAQQQMLRESWRRGISCYSICLLKQLLNVPKPCSPKRG